MDKPVHAYAMDGDLGPDWRGDVPCGVCRLPRRHPRHELPETPDEDISDRIIGEGDECR
jgi:hypothetical protein